MIYFSIYFFSPGLDWNLNVSSVSQQNITFSGFNLVEFVCQCNKNMRIPGHTLVTSGLKRPKLSVVFPFCCLIHSIYFILQNGLHCGALYKRHCHCYSQIVVLDWYSYSLSYWYWILDRYSVSDWYLLSETTLTQYQYQIKRHRDSTRYVCCCVSFGASWMLLIVPSSRQKSSTFPSNKCIIYW